MTSGDPLFDLIHSMTTHEKIFFKRYAALSGKKKPHYVRLFDVMDSFKKYDEAKLKRKLQKEVFANRLAFERSYLKNALLESLSAGQMGKKQGSKPQALSSQLRVDLGYVFILTEKGSYDLAIKLNENILKQAEEGELFHIWGAALQQKYSLMFLSQRGEKGFEKRLTQVMDAQIELAKKVVDSQEYKKLSFEAARLAHSKGATLDSAGKKEIETFLEQIKGNIPPRSVRAGIMRRDALTHLYNALERRDKLYEIQTEELESIDKWPQIVSFSNKLLVIAKYVSLCTMMERFDRANAAIEKLYKITPADESQEQEYWERSIVALVQFFVVSGQFPRALEIEEKSRNILEINTTIPPALRIDIYGSYISLYIASGEYEKAIEWHEMMLAKEGGNDFAEDLQVKARLMGLVAHYELGNHLLINSHCRAIQRILLRRKYPAAMESVVLKFIKVVPPTLEEAEHWQKFKEQMLPFLEDTVERQKFQLFDFICWIDSKLQKRPLMELLKEKREAAGQ